MSLKVAVHRLPLFDVLLVIFVAGVSSALSWNLGFTVSGVNSNTKKNIRVRQAYLRSVKTLVPILLGLFQEYYRIITKIYYFSNKLLLRLAQIRLLTRIFFSVLVFTQYIYTNCDARKKIYALHKRICAKRKIYVKTLV